MIGWLVVSSKERQVRPGADLESPSDLGDHIACLLRRTHPGTRRQNIPVIVRQAFVDPEEIILHGLVEVCCPEVSRPAKFAIPGMGVFMWQKRAARNACRPIGKVVAARAVLT